MRLPGPQRKPLIARRTASTRPDGILLLQLVGMDAVEFEAIMCNEVTIVDDLGRVDFQILRRRWSSHNWPERYWSDSHRTILNRGTAANIYFTN